MVFSTGVKNKGINSCLKMFVSFCVSLQGSEGVIVGVVDFWVRLFPPAEPMDTMVERAGGRRTATQRSPVQISLGWQESSHEVKQREQILPC